MTGSDPTFLGRVVRWYYSTRPGLSINYASNGNLVPKSEGGMPCMALPDKLPGDVDFACPAGVTEADFPQPVATQPCQRMGLGDWLARIIAACGARPTDDCGCGSRKVALNDFGAAIARAFRRTRTGFGFDAAMAAEGW